MFVSALNSANLIPLFRSKKFTATSPPGATIHKMKSRILQKSLIVLTPFIFAIAILAIPSIALAQTQSLSAKQSFVSHCAACHGEDGHGGQLGPNIIDVANPRATSAQAVHTLIRSGIPSAGMPAFATLSDAEVDSIASYVMSLKAAATAAAGGNANANAAHQAPVAGDITAGFQFLSTQGNCLSCHAIRGRGGVIGPDLGSIATKRTAQQIEQALRNPGSLPQTPLAAAGGTAATNNSTAPTSAPPTPRQQSPSPKETKQSAASSSARPTSISNSWASTATSTCSPKTKSQTSRPNPNP